MDVGIAPSFSSRDEHLTVRPGRESALLLGVILILTFSAYAGTLRFQFVYDDGVQIVYNPAVHSWGNLPRLFTEQVWSGQASVAPNYFRPVFMTWCLALFKLFGTNPMGWHAGVVLLHLLVTALVFLLARKVTGDEITASIAALVFGLDPIHVESVAWISGGTDPLMSLFCLGSFLCYLRFQQEGQRRYIWLLASLVQYALACLSKEPGIMLAGIVAVYAWLTSPGTPFLARLRRSLWHAAPFAAVGGLYLLQRLRVLAGLAHPVITLPVTKMPLSWPELWWFYLSKLVLPVRLSPFYDSHYVLAPTWVEFWMPLILVLAAGAAFWGVVRRLPDGSNSPRTVAWLGAAWVVLPLLPAMNIVALEPHEFAHDRYLYLPSVGITLLAAIAVRHIRIGPARAFGQPAAQIVCVMALVATLGVATVRQSVYWANDFLLYYRGVAISPNSLTALNNLANALLERNNYDEGIRMHERILRADPDYWMSHFNVALAYYKLGQYQKCEEHLVQAARLNPGSPQIAIYLAIAKMKNQHLDDAELSARRAVGIWPNVVGGHYVLGLVLEQQGRWSEAVEAFRQELALDSDQPTVREGLARAERNGR